MKKTPRIKIITGHFGSGKTEIALNLALKEKEDYDKVVLCDLDVINPYYRSREEEATLTKQGIELVAPKGKLATADLPIVSGEIYRYIHHPDYQLIVDAGGDKDGATALGQYYNDWKDLEVDVLFVLNGNRPYVSTVEGALETIRNIEAAARLKVTGIINNTNVSSETTLSDIQKGLELSQFVAEKLDLPLLYTTISDAFRKEVEEFANTNQVMFIQRFMKQPWD